MRPRWRRHSANIAIGQGCLPAPMKCRITMLFAAVHEPVVDPDLSTLVAMPPVWRLVAGQQRVGVVSMSLALSEEIDASAP
jgi:hypothetical protein